MSGVHERLDAGRIRRLWTRLAGIDLARAVVLISSATAVARVLGLVSALATAVVLGPRELGLYAFLLATSAVVSACGVLGFAPLTTRAIADAEDEVAKRHAASTALRWCTSSLLGVAFAYAVVMAVVGQRLGLSVDVGRASVLIVMGWSAATGLNALLAAVFAGYSNFRLVARANVLRAVAVGFLAVAGGWLGGRSLDAAAGAALGELLTLVWGVTASLRRGMLDLRWRDRARGMSVSTIKPVLGAGVASLTIQVAMWVAQLLLLRQPDGAAANGGFLLANRLTLVVAFIPSAVAVAALPRLAQSGRPRDVLRREGLRLLLASFGLALAPAALVALVSPFLFVLGDGYREFQMTVVLMAVAGVAISLNNVASSLAVAFGYLRHWIVSDALLAVVLVSAAAGLAPVLGADGLALAYLAGYVVSVVVLAPVISRGPRKGVLTAP